MPAPAPQFIPEAFAISAAPSNRNTIPAAPATTQRASFDLGFPPLTMQPVISGGKPMLGPDMNGILYMLSSHTVYQQSGQPYMFSSAVAAVIGGFAIGTLLGMADGSGVWLNQVASNVSNPDANGAGWVASTSYGYASIGGLSGGVRTLTPLEYRRNMIVLTGALVANQQVVLPITFQRWLVVNWCTGPFTVTVKTAAGSGVAIPAGGWASPTEVYGDGTNINLVVSPAALPIDVNPTADTIAKRDNLGYLYTQSPGAGENTTRVATTAMVQSVATATLSAAVSADVGEAQAWADVAGSRTFDTPYVNPYPKPIQVSLNVDVSPGGGVVFWVNGVPIATQINGSASVIEDLSITPIIPPGHTYILTYVGPCVIQNWAELI